MGVAQPRPGRGGAGALQRALKAELDALGEVDPYVDEELALLGDGPGQTRV
ncbi:hypothetical protein [Nocardioides sp. TF02-7]|uniref:hypothetical protein n=1 Tax=Nocardioides sp. TF02-7 TaxID=2917724 RepID=UPI001F055443|nr:hypothetical protein [Nocardioides sp. TF02-7]UMG94976.1 hypothetical protein MF408_14605 [Nocardioides sp. TF02-7]